MEGVMYGWIVVVVLNSWSDNGGYIVEIGIKRMLFFNNHVVKDNTCGHQPFDFCEISHPT